MSPPRHLLLPTALCVLATPGPCQVFDADEGMFAGAGGVLAVDAGTGLPGRLLTKEPGYFTTYPPERPPVAGAPDFRVQSMIYAQRFPPTGAVEIDAFSIGADWIVANDVGECFGPEGRFAVLLFSVTRGINGASGTIGNEAGNGQDGAAADLFCYEFEGDQTTSLVQDLVTRALDSTAINIRPGNGMGNMTAFDWFAAIYAGGQFSEQLPKAPTAYFSVSTSTAQALPLQWCGNAGQNRSGATVFQTTWQPRTATWSTPTVYCAPGDLGLGSGDDLDALAVDTMHHTNHYLLFSAANPPGDRLRFLNRGTGFLGTYRFGNGGPTVESRLGLGNGDVDAVCSIDPGADELPQLAVGIDAPTPSWWPAPGGSQGGVSCTLYRTPGSPALHGFAGSHSLGSNHDWYVNFPDAQPGGLLLGPFTITAATRQQTWKGAPSHFVWPMNAAGLDQRAEFGVVEHRAGIGSFGSRFVGITEWKERVTTLTAPAAFAATEGGSSGNIWRAGPNRVQCLYDTSNFTSQGVGHPIYIDELEWRTAGDLIGTAVTYSSVSLWLGYAATDHLAPSTTFTSNRTPSHTLVYSGQVDFQPAWGTSPNSFSIRVPLTTGFVYDPSLGLDLLLEIEIPTAPFPTVGNTMSTGYSAALHAANTVRSIGTTTASTGSISAFCPVCRFGYTTPAGVARTTEYGGGCYDSFASFREEFPSGSFDLGGWPINSIRLTPAGGGYAVAQGSNGWHTPTGAGLGLTDDVYATVPLPTPFYLPGGGSMSALLVYSNGFVTPYGPTTDPSGNPPTTAVLLSGPPRFGLCWADLLPDGATNVANVFADHDPGPNVFCVTWLGVPTYTPGGAVTMQLAFDLTTMEVEYRWEQCRLPTPAMVAFTPGYGALDSGSRDLHDLPFTTAPDLPALHLSATPRAVIGSAVAYTIEHIDPTALLSAEFMALGGVDPGIDLTALGMPGCRQYVDLTSASAFLLFGSPTATRMFAIPPNPSLTGLRLDNQAASLLPGANQLGVVTSNGVVTVVGTW